MTRVLDFRTPGKSVRQPASELRRTVFLVGFMGAGKTSTARKLARYAGAVSIDMDMYLERRCDMKAREIIEEYGEERFREIETEVLRELAMGEPRIVSCGGGVVIRPENRDIVRAHGFVVYLKVTAEEAASRISNLATRPLFGDLAHAEEVIAGRLPLYEEVADVTIDTAGRGTASIAREALSCLMDAGVLKMGDERHGD